MSVSTISAQANSGKSARSIHSTSTSQSSRLLSLDLFRGLTILLMVIVNSPDLTGQWHHAYWDGVTIADWVFPWFLLIVGVSLAINEPKLLQQRQQLGDRALLWVIAKRTLQLFALGLLVNLFYTDFSAIRVLGVLQRIAIVYFCCALLLLYLPRKMILLLGVVLLLGYWALLSFVQFPGALIGDLTRGNTVVNLFDQQYLPGKLWRGHWDPEGLLSTLPSIATGISGLWVGWLLQGVTAMPAAQATRRWLQLLLVGVALTALGWVWSLPLWSGALPMIKQIWSSSFVLYTSGLGFIALVLLQLCYRRFGTLFGLSLVVSFLKVLGMNATVLYLWHVVLHYLFTKSLFTKSWWLHWSGDSTAAKDQAGSFYQWLMQLTDGPGGIATALYLLIFVTLSVLPNFWLYQRRIFVKL